jgi:RNA polymerase sigma factor (sigma-70 family)
MSAEPLDALLDKLTTGDNAAAEQVFRSYEPYLRMVVRRQLSPGLRAKFDSLDVVQSVWVHVLRGSREAGWRFADVTHLRAFLVQLTRRRFIDRLRRHSHLRGRARRWAEADSAGAPVADDPQPDDVLAAEDLWRELLQLCPPAHREVLRLKRDGAPTAEVAARTGLHEGSVRRILNALARRLARRRDDNSPRGGRPG